jgi:thiamine transporter ThiT
MTKNMGTVDRSIRILIALGIAALYFTGHIGGTLGIILGVVAIVFLLTSFIGWCPAYITLGISTCEKSHGTPGV